MNTTLPHSPCQFLNREGMRLAGHQWGNPQAPSVLMLHGGGQTRHAWSKTAKALASHGFHVIAIDMRGHGDSDRGKDYSVTAFSRDIQDVASSLTDKPVLVGASLGGLASLLANAGAQEISRALVLVDIAPRLDQGGVGRILSFMAAQPDGFASLEEAADAVAAYQPHRPRPDNHDGLRKNLRQRDNGRWYWHWDPKMLETFQSRFDAGGADNDHRFWDAAEALRQPVLLVRGSQSDVVSDSTTKEFRQRVPHADTVDVSDAGHMVAGDRNDAFSDAIIAFLARYHQAGSTGS